MPPVRRIEGAPENPYAPRAIRYRFGHVKDQLVALLASSASRPDAVS